MEINREKIINNKKINLISLYKLHNKNEEEMQQLKKRQKFLKTIHSQLNNLELNQQGKSNKEAQDIKISKPQDIQTAMAIFEYKFYMCQRQLKSIQEYVDFINKKVSDLKEQFDEDIKNHNVQQNKEPPTAFNQLDGINQKLNKLLGAINTKEELKLKQENAIQSQQKLSEINRQLQIESKKQTYCNHQQIFGQLRANKQEYEAQILFKNINSLIKGIKIINFQKLEQKYDCLVSFIGRSRSGKTFLMNKLLDREILNYQYFSTDQGLNFCFRQDQNKKICFLDVPGFNNCGIQEESAFFQADDQDCQKFLFQNNNSLLIYSDWLENFIIMHSTKIIIVVQSPITREDMIYIQNIQRKIVKLIDLNKIQYKEIFIIHNFQSITTLFDLQNSSKQQLKNFGAGGEINLSQELNFQQYLDDLKNYPLQHFFIAQEFSPAAEKINDTCFQKLKASFRLCSQNTQQVTKHFVEFLNNTCQNYLFSHKKSQFQHKENCIIFNNQQQLSQNQIKIQLSTRHLFLRNDGFVGTDKDQEVLQYAVFETEIFFIVYLQSFQFGSDEDPVKLKILNNKHVLEINGEHRQQQQKKNIEEKFNFYSKGKCNFKITICQAGSYDLDIDDTVLPWNDSCLFIIKKIKQHVC